MCCILFICQWFALFHSLTKTGAKSAYRGYSFKILTDLSPVGMWSVNFIKLIQTIKFVSVSFSNSLESLSSPCVNPSLFIVLASYSRVFPHITSFTSSRTESYVTAIHLSTLFDMSIGSTLI